MDDGFTATISFSLLIRNPTAINEIIVALMENGASALRSIDGQTSRVADVRSQARLQAMGAAPGRRRRCTVARRGAAWVAS